MVGGYSERLCRTIAVAVASGDCNISCGDAKAGYGDRVNNNAEDTKLLTESEVASNKIRVYTAKAK